MKEGIYDYKLCKWIKEAGLKLRGADEPEDASNQGVQPGPEGVLWVEAVEQSEGKYQERPSLVDEPPRPFGALPG